MQKSKNNTMKAQTLLTLVLGVPTFRKVIPSISNKIVLCQTADHLERLGVGVSVNFEQCVDKNLIFY